MKILLVTDQYIEVRDDGCWCNFALFGTINNMRILGEIYLLGGKLCGGNKPAQPITERLDFIPVDHVDFLLPQNKNLKQYFKNQAINKKAIERMVHGKDLVIGYAPSSNSEYAQKLAHKQSIPFMSFLVASPWDSLIHHRRFLARVMAPIRYFSTRKMLRKSDYAHYVTHQYLQKMYPTNGLELGCSDINLGEFDKEALQRRLEKCKDNSEIKLVTVGSLDAGYKGQEYVMRAMAMLREEGDERYHYYLIGGHKGIRLRKIAKELEIENNVHFMGSQPITEVFAWLDKCDIYLQPSLQEGLPRSVIEAMSRALPCIGFETGGIPELLESQYIVKQKDVKGIVYALKALNSEKEYQRVAERNFKEAQTYEHSLLQKQIQDFFKIVKSELEKKQNNELDRKNQ